MSSTNLRIAESSAGTKASIIGEIIAPTEFLRYRREVAALSMELAKVFSPVAFDHS